MYAPILLGTLLLSACGSSGGGSSTTEAQVKSLFPTAVDASESGEGNNSIGLANEIQLESTQEGTIFPKGDIDWFSVDLLAGTTYEISVNGLCNGCDTQIELHQEGVDGRVGIAYDYFNEDTRLLYNVPQDSKYFIKLTAASHPNQVSNYTLSAHEYINEDNDGYSNYYDCNDSDFNAYPRATEIAADGIDQDCNGTDLLGNNIADAFEPNNSYKSATLVPYIAGNFDEDVYIFQQHGNDIHTIHNESDEDWHKLVIPAYSAATLSFRSNSFQPNVEAFQSDGVTPLAPDEDALINKTGKDSVIFLKLSENGTGTYMPYARFYGYDKDQDGFFTMQSTSDYDCNDNDASINPDADDVLDDGIDSNCDTLD